LPKETEMTEEDWDSLTGRAEVETGYSGTEREMELQDVIKKGIEQIKAQLP